MRYHILISLTTLMLAACGADEGKFAITGCNDKDQY